MAQLLIWGTTRELIGGPLPPTTRPLQVSTLAAVQAAAEHEIAVLVLADPACLDAERGPLEEWLHDGGAGRAVIMAVADPADSERLLERLPFVEDVLPQPVSAASLERRLGHAIDALQDRRAIRQLEDALARKSEALREVNQIGVALSAEKDIDRLLELILSKSREITRADAGSLYLMERTGDGDGDGRQQLRFKLAQNDSVVVPFEEFVVPLESPSIAGYVALSGQHVNVADSYDLPPGTPFRASRSFDQTSGYRTKSNLVVPMRDHENTVIGVLQLINKKRSRRTVLRPIQLVEEEVIPFPTSDEELVSSLASQAAVALQNARLLQDIRRLFEAFVRASVTAIEQRDPTTSGHSERVATLCVTLAERVDAVDRGELAEVRFTRDQLRELRYAALLHDFGKVGVREKLLIKGKKLFYGQMKAVEQRFAYIDKALEAELAQRKLELLSAGNADPGSVAALDAEYKARREDVARIFKMVQKANEPTVLEEENYRMLLELPQRTFVDWNGQRQPYLTASELAALSIRKGSLSEDERRQVEGHVTHTYEFLSQIPWTGEYRGIPEIAWAHHEKLDGSGYPRRLTAPQIPIQSRMMAISDIFDALVAWDRPYKPAVSTERALAILADEARRGKLDPALLEVFLEARVYESTQRK